MKKMPFFGVILAALLFSLQAQASTFYLNQSNELDDGVNYAAVDVTEDNGNLNFEVQALYPTNWKFSDFFFNLDYTGTVEITGLPAFWSVDVDQNASQFGVFTDHLDGSGKNLQSSLSFTVDGADDLFISNLLANDKGWIFAAHMQCQSKDKSAPCYAEDGETSHFVAGTGDVSNVPVPAAVWLFGSALAGLGTLGRRKKA